MGGTDLSGITEAAFCELIERVAVANGWLVNHVRPLPLPRAGGRWVTAAATGFPDYVMLRDGVTLVVEVKTASGRLTADQRKWLAAFQEAAKGNPDYLVGVCRPGDWPALHRILTKPRPTKGNQP